MIEEIKYHIGDLPDDVILQGDLAIDTETMGLNLLRDKLCVVQIADSAGNVYIVQFRDGDYRAPNLKKYLSNPDSVKIFHFARFDVAAIKHYLGIELQNIFCTKISSKLSRTYTDSHGLKDLCRELLAVQISKQQQSSDWGADSLSEEQLQYAAGDVVYLHQLRDILTDMLEREGRMQIAEQLFAFIGTRAELDLIGWNEIDIFAH